MSNLPSLYELRNEYQQLMNTLADGVFDAQTIKDTIEASGITDSIAVKGQNIVMVARSFEQHTDAIDCEIKRLQALKKQRQGVADRLREYLLENMIGAQIEKIEGPLITITIRNNPESVDVFDADQIPTDYMRQPETPPPAPDKALIKGALKNGQDVPGCRLVRSKKLHIA